MPTVSIASIIRLIHERDLMRVIYATFGRSRAHGSIVRSLAERIENSPTGRSTNDTHLTCFELQEMAEESWLESGQEVDGPGYSEYLDNLIVMEGRSALALGNFAAALVVPIAP